MTIVPSPPAATLTGNRVLVVEDIYWIADDLRRALVERGMTVLGPVGRVDQALALLDAGGIDAAVLDINLDGEPSYPVAERLNEQDIPFVFATGYDEWAIPADWRAVRRVGKPVSTTAIVAAMEALLQPATTGVAQ